MKDVKATPVAWVNTDKKWTGYKDKAPVYMSPTKAK
jgi:hypothetical protein